MAMAARRERGLFDPDTDPGRSPFDHHVYAICSDGDIEEGVSHESSAIAAVQKLGNLTLIYDDNEISIEDDTRIAKNEDVGARYAAYGWDVQHVDWRKGDPAEGDYHEDVEALYQAILAAKAVTDKPSFIVLKTIIGWPAPNKQNTGKIHGSALGADEVAATKEILGFDPNESFAVDEKVLEHARQVVARGREAHAEWQKAFDAWAAKPTTRRASCSTGCPSPHAAGGLGRRRCPSSRPTPRASPPGPRPARCWKRSRRCCRSCGAARPTWPRATTPR